VSKRGKRVLKNANFDGTINLNFTAIFVCAAFNSLSNIMAPLQALSKDLGLQPRQIKTQKEYI
jgi:hypothetical protein